MQPADHDDGMVLPLAYGELTDRDIAELGELKRVIEERVGFHCHDYKEKCLRRRIAVRMRACGVHSYGAYAVRLLHDDGEYARLLDAITINVSKFFRNADMWNTLRRVVLPALFARPASELRAWSAGCATGEEPYSVAIAAREYAEESGHDANRLRILGTDIDRASLLAAERGEYGAFSFSEMPPHQRSRWFTGPAQTRIPPAIRAMAEFRLHDMMREELPAGQHLVLCRNVVIYLERAAQQRLFRRFADAVVPGGFLVLGKVESMFGPAATMFQPVAGRERVFRRV